jgi:hypothetical protein
LLGSEPGRVVTSSLWIAPELREEDFESGSMHA